MVQPLQTARRADSIDSPALTIETPQRPLPNARPSYIAPRGVVTVRGTNGSAAAQFGEEISTSSSNGQFWVVPKDALLIGFDEIK